MRAGSLKTRLNALEARLTPKGKLIVVSTPDDAALLKAGPQDVVIITGVPRAPDWRAP